MLCHILQLDVNLFARNQVEPTAEVLAAYNDVLASLCLVPGDAVMPSHARELNCFGEKVKD